MNVWMLCFIVFVVVELITYKKGNPYRKEELVLKHIPIDQLQGAKKQIMTLDMLYPGKEPHALQKQLWLRKLHMAWYVAGILILAFCLVGMMPSEIDTMFQQPFRIDRPESGEGDRKQQFLIQTDALESQKIEVEVQERAYTKDTYEAAVEKGRTYIESVLPGENLDLLQVEKPLVLPDTIPGTLLSVEWELDQEGIIQPDGTLDFEKLHVTQQRSVTIKAMLRYDDYEEILTFSIVIKNKPKTSEEVLLEEWRERFQALEDVTRTETYQSLPETVGGEAVRYEPIREDNTKIMLFLLVLIVFMVIYIQDQKLIDATKKREKQIILDYPEMINKFVLLLGAGMTVGATFERICNEYQKKREGREKELHYVYEEMILVLREIDNGVSQHRAYEHFGQRMRRMEYLKFSTLISQNLKKGNDTILELLQLEAVEAFERRKEYAKKQGEEAGTKLLFPMILMMVLVMGIIMIPAFMTF